MLIFHNFKSKEQSSQRMDRFPQESQVTLNSMVTRCKYFCSDGNSQEPDLSGLIPKPRVRARNILNAGTNKSNAQAAINSAYLS